MSDSSPTVVETVHVPILLEPIADALCSPLLALPKDAPPHWIVDCTFGGGGHSARFLEKLAGTQHKILGVDQDPHALERARLRFVREISEGRLELLHSRFADADFGGRQILGMLADLGFSSDQLEDAGRGLSFQNEGPLDMRLDPTQGEPAWLHLQQMSEKEIADVIFEYGEERFSRRIAAAIVEARREGRLPKTTLALAELVSRAVPAAARHGRIHAATRTFQALRIFVNEELNQLDSLLERATLILKPQGRLAIISFHSLEDRRVKLLFKERNGPFEPLTKKPIEADEEEIRRNPRSRSAKLRIAVRRETSS